MFDIDSGKLLIIAVLALIVIGPKDLPRVLRQLGQMVGRLRRMASEFQGQFMDAIKEAEIDDIRKEINSLKSSTDIDVNFDPARDIQAEFTGAMAASDTVSGQSEIKSVTSGFELPAVPPALDETETAHATGVAPDVDELPTTPAHEVIALNGASALSLPAAKRKIILKPRRSSFNLVRIEAAASEAPVTRRRIVRRKTDSPDVQSS